MNDHLQMTDEEVARLTRPQRERRLKDLLEDATEIFETTRQLYIPEGGKHELKAVCVLFSGGNDSTVLAHMFKDRSTHAVHCHTTVGIEETRQFVRDTTDAWGLPLIERMPPRMEDRYRALVLNKGFSKNGDPLGGFPGPGMHWKMWNRLKQRGLEQVQRELVSAPHKQRTMFIAGRRRAESNRRAKIPQNGPWGSVIWCSPLIHWTKPDLNTYRLVMGDVPVNDVANLLHLSGECLCGAYASAGERDQIEDWFPMALDEIREMEAILQTPEYAHIPYHRRFWGWNAIPELSKLAKAEEKNHRAGGLCESCSTRGTSA